MFVEAILRVCCRAVESVVARERVVDAERFGTLGWRIVVCLLMSAMLLTGSVMLMDDDDLCGRSTPCFPGLDDDSAVIGRSFKGCALGDQM